MLLSAAELSSILAGSAILLVALALGRSRSRVAMDARLRTYVRREATPVAVSLLRVRDEHHSAFVERLNRRLRQLSLAKRLHDKLTQAGIEAPAGRILMFQGIGAALAFWLASLLGSAKLGEPLLGLAAGGAAAVAAWMLPNMILDFSIGRRLKKFEDQLPVAVDAIAGALQAGSSLNQSMELVSREMAAPIGVELAAVVREMSVGVPMSVGFERMVERVHSPDLDMLVTAINIQHRVGGNLSQILRTIAHTIRERLRIKGEIGILTAQQRLAAIIVSCLPLIIVLALFFIAPDYIMKLFEPGIARMLLMAGVVGIAAGFYCLRKIAQIDV